jgi:hypothetical protein
MSKREALKRMYHQHPSVETLNLDSMTDAEVDDFYQRALSFLSEKEKIQYQRRVS